MKNHYTFKIKPIAIAIALAGGSSSTVLAQNNSLEEVVVTGIRASLQQAVDIKREANGVVDAISAEDIGKFPDTNLAESLQRITGVSIDRSGGEGRQVSVRGMGPSFNLVLLNGRQMPSKESGRAFNFDEVAAEMVSGVEVYKTSSAAVQSGGIGATINIKTARPLDIGDKMAGSVKLSSDLDAGGTTPQASGLFSKNLDDSFGILLAASYQQRESQEDQLRVTKWNVDPDVSGVANFDNSANTNNHIFVPQQSAFNRRQDTRTRINGNLVLQYAPSDTLTATADLQYSDFKIDRYAEELALWFSQNTAQSIVTDKNGTVVAYDQGASTIDFFTKAPTSRTVNTSAGLNVDWAITDAAKLSVEHSASTSESNPDGEYNINQSDVQIAQNWGFAVSGDLAFPVFNSDATATPSVQDPSRLRTWVNELYSNNYKDEINQTRADFTFDDGGSTTLAAGAMFTDQTKTISNISNNLSWDDFAWDTASGYGQQDVNDADYTWVALDSGFMDQFSGSADLRALNLGNYSFDPNAVRAAWLADAGAPADHFEPTFQNSSFIINEKTTAAYFELTTATDFAGKDLTLVAGARYESTAIDSTGVEASLTMLTFTDPEENMTTTFSAEDFFTASAGYDVLLPNMSAKLALNDDMVVRVAASRSLTRPSLDKMTPVRTIATTRPGLLAGSAGSPDLKPFIADNFDLSLEWYLNEVDYISAGFFLKNVNNFIVDGVLNETINGVTDPSTGTDPEGPDAADQLAEFEITRPVNGEDAQLHGFELAGQHAFGDTGFGTIANLTLVYTDSDYNVDDVKQTFAVTGLSHSANLVGYYEKGPFQARIAYNWRDEFLQRFGQTSQATTEPTIVDAYSQIDLSASYDISDNVSVFMEGINVTDQGNRSHGRYANQLVEATTSGPRYAVGVRAQF
ncbi:TonB-dependent receptor [Saccharophagus degradans]|uniref:TonB-dependent receptor n=1 Tax=Saccharophagus degradans TaxID=86304 RepID=A0AAW7X4U6_9GAMM|nr:TonB-dependent receptor [Saccharophagus degradans]MBU2985085.1 TonB-dependent receptor [Saccharophagus degradans]MDO6421587.1 TonB-dependent receptor [Saccharophagus degradans]MDO6608549.1 TonB-dependent receptor [Saccharophagus degradans]